MNADLHIAVLFVSDPADQASLSGMPYAAARALERCGCDVIPIEAFPRAAPRLNFAVQPVTTWLKRRLPEPLLEWRRTARRHVLAEARAAAARISGQLANIRAEREIDLLFGMCISVPLAFLETDLPIVYATDATARIIFTSYPRLSRRNARYREECEECERRALHRARLIALASHAAIRSAEEEYGVHPSRLRLLPLGAHVVVPPNGPSDADPPLAVPTRESTRLLLVASDPERKRVRFAVDVARDLRRREIGAELIHIGQPHRCLRQPFVRTLGPLRIGSPADHARHIEAILETHLSILPSLGEAFGIAPAESALAGRPAIVSDAGGLPTVVRHGETGIVLPVAASVTEWADAIERLIDDPDRYRRLALAARDRAWREFTWDAWGRGMKEMMLEARS